MSWPDLEGSALWGKEEGCKGSESEGIGEGEGGRVPMGEGLLGKNGPQEWEQRNQSQPRSALLQLHCPSLPGCFSAV